MSMQCNNNGTQLPPPQHNALPNQGQIYMSQQNENLEYMYTLVKQLRTQTKRNQQLKDSIIEGIDTLSNKLNRNPEKRKDNISKDMSIFELFLNRNSLSTVNQQTNDAGSVDSDENLGTLRRQNNMLQELLNKRKQISSCSVHTLNHHEDSLSEVINLLRNDILQYQTTTLEEIRQEFATTLLKYEDKEFQEYLGYTEELQKVFDITKVYRIICSLLEDSY